MLGFCIIDKSYFARCVNYIKMGCQFIMQKDLNKIPRPNNATRICFTTFRPVNSLLLTKDNLHGLGYVEL